MYKAGLIISHPKPSLWLPTRSLVDKNMLTSTDTIIHCSFSDSTYIGTVVALLLNVKSCHARDKGKNLSPPVGAELMPFKTCACGMLNTVHLFFKLLLRFSSLF